MRFTREERADPTLEKPIRRAERAAAKADKAQAKLPKQLAREKSMDPATGKITTKLVLEDKKPPSKLGMRDDPVNFVAGTVHREIRQSEKDNVGVESAHKSEEAAETGVHLMQEGSRSHKLKPYRKAAQAERRLEKANVNALYQKSLRENPHLASNPFSRWQQKHQIKKQYAAAKRASSFGSGTASQAGKAARTATDKARQAGAFVLRHKRGFGIVLALFVVVCMLLNTLSSCSMMAQNIGSAVAGSTYPSDDPELVAVEAGYPYWSWYGFPSRVEWCACFVSWCYGQVGLSEPRFAGCQSQGAAWFQSHGQWGARGYENIAPGDAIFFDWDLDGGADHVGIVIGSDGSKVYTVEGNSGDACKIRSYSLTYECIKGYGLMNW